MTVAIVQSKYGTTPTNGWVSGGAQSVVFTSTPTNGNKLLALVFMEGILGGGYNMISSAGWSFVGTSVNAYGCLHAYSKTAGASETKTVTVSATAGGVASHLGIFEISGGSLVSSTFQDNKPIAASLTTAAVTPSVNPGLLIAGFLGQTKTYTGPAVWTPTSPLTAIYSSSASGRGEAFVGYVTTSTGSYTPTVGQTGLDYQNTNNVVLLYQGTAAFPPVADFSADNVDDIGPYTATFTDLSTNTPTSWAWDFGDGSTSTSQNPSHVYSTPGTYTVSLTATNADGSDTETKAAYINVDTDVDYEAPGPDSAVIEIYASAPGSARWDDATWDDFDWSAAAWQDVTPESVAAVIRWGSNQPELGILTTIDAGSWNLDLYDPQRLLDPANEDSPYFGDLLPGLPIRVLHRSTVVRQGIVEGMGHDFSDDTGYIRVHDSKATLANADVPHDTALADTLYARAREAIAAAGLVIDVLPDPASGDPDLYPWADPGSDMTVWEWIADAGQSVLQIPYIDRLGRVGFRPWADPLYRGRELSDPELISLLSIVQYDGLYSRVTATDGVTPETRSLTPTPRYGIRTYERSDPIPGDPGDWAQAVLEDRAITGIRWVPGEVYPLTAASVEDFATIEPVELVSIVNDSTEPVVNVAAIIVGGEIRINAKADDEALWSFLFQAAQSVELPLVVTDSDPPEFLLRTGGGEFLYPSL